MGLPETTCPECGGRAGEDAACEHCGYQLEDDEDAWLSVGDSLQARIDASAIGLDGDEEVVVELEIVENWEAYETQRVFRAEAVGLAGEESGDHLAELGFVVEQEAEPVRCRAETLPDALGDRVRQPLFRTEDGHGLVVSVFLDDGGLALHEIVDIAGGELNLEQIRGLFLPLLDAVEQLHDRELLHLRLTPWTIRLTDETEHQGLPLDFLRQAMAGEEPDAVDEPAGLDEETLSEVEVDESGESEETGGDFASARTDEKTREDVVPLVDAELARAGASVDDEAEIQDLDDPSSPAAGARVVATDTGALIGRRVDEIELDVLFDGLDGFFPEDGQFDEVPVVRGFSPPELMRRSQMKIGPSCDIFNLGMILYFLIAGEFPPVSVYTRHVPSLPVRNLRPSFPPGLQSVIGRATRPEADERYPTVSSLRKAFLRACAVMQTRADRADEPPEMRLAVDTHIGIAKGQRNPINQDAVFAASSEDGHFAVIVVADGVSTASYGSGDLASRILVDEAAAAWEELLPSYLMDESIDAPQAVQEILNRANERIVDYVNEEFTPFRGSPHEVMGTTALVAIVQKETVTLGSLGDSRVYLQRGEAFEQLTIDHNLWTLSILEGVPADNALAMPHGDALAKCLGTFLIEDERLEAVDPEPDLYQFAVTQGDNLLLTTDGLVDFAAANMIAAEDKIHQSMVSEPNPALACLELILAANRGGGGDNIGVGIVKFT